MYVCMFQKNASLSVCIQQPLAKNKVIEWTTKEIEMPKQEYVQEKSH